MFRSSTFTQRSSANHRNRRCLKYAAAVIVSTALVATTVTVADAAPARTGSSVVATAMKWRGTPYRWGGNTPGRGLDCSGLVQQAFKRNGKSLPRTARQQAKMGKRVASLKQARPGDLVTFGSPAHHIGIYVGNGKMIHAPRTGDVVKVAKVYRTPTSIRRIMPTSTASTPKKKMSAHELHMHHLNHLNQQKKR